MRWELDGTPIGRRPAVAGGDMPALLDEDGAAVVIHAQPDDHMTQPIGGAGGRIACGVIEKMT